MEKFNTPTPTDESAATWLSDLVMEDYNFPPEECHINLFEVDETSAIQKQQPLSLDFERPTKLLIKNTRSSSTNNNNNHLPKSSLSSNITENFPPKLSFSSSSSILSFQSHQILSFDNSSSYYGGFDSTLLNPKQHHDDEALVLGNRNMHFALQDSNPKGLSSSKTTRNLMGTKTTHYCKKPSLAQAKDHVLAERKRREKLSQSFIALAALLPGLKKMEKATVLEEAIKYVKELKERQAMMEEEMEKIKAESAMVIQNKPDLINGSGDFSSSLSSCDVESTNNNNVGDVATTESLLQVEAKVLGQEVLIRIHCKKQEGIFVKLLSEIQTLHLSALSCSVLPFGNFILDITIIAQMGEGYNLTLEELVSTIRAVTLKFFMS